MSTAIRLKKENHIAWISLARPDKLNAINAQMLSELSETLDLLEKDSDLRVIILAGDGNAFSSGIDTKWLAGDAATKLQPSEDEAMRLRAFIRWIQNINSKLERIEKPTIAMLHGYCVGLGLEIALACDFRFAAEGCQLGLPEIIMGIIPDCGGTTRLSRLCGIARAKELIMTGDLIDATRAERYNLVHNVIKSDELRQHVLQFVEKLSKRSAASLGLTKKLIDLGHHLDRHTHFELEALTQSILMSSKHLPQHMMAGMKEIQAKKN